MNKMKYIKVTDKINDVETLFRLLLAGVPKRQIWQTLHMTVLFTLYVKT